MLVHVHVDNWSYVFKAAAATGQDKGVDEEAYRKLKPRIITEVVRSSVSAISSAVEVPKGRINDFNAHYADFDSHQILLNRLKVFPFFFVGKGCC